MIRSILFCIALPFAAFALSACQSTMTHDQTMSFAFAMPMAERGAERGVDPNPGVPFQCGSFLLSMEQAEAKNAAAN